MNSEIEAKFLHINHEEIRERLQRIGAELEKPMHLMRRVTFDNAAMKAKGGWIRVRDEGDKVTVCYKQVDSLTVDGVREIETTAGDFEAMVAIFKALELAGGSFQESKRETWRLDDVEIALDEWPWLDPYIEIEGADELSIRTVADKLGLDWADAKHGDVMTAYRAQYPWLGEHDTVGNLDFVRFSDPAPTMLQQK